MHNTRYFSAEPSVRAIATQLYSQVATSPLLCLHGHVDPRVFADPQYSFGTPVDLLIIPDHYVFRMLYSQGVALEQQGIPRRDGQPVEQDHRHIWQAFAERFYLFRGTPTGTWLRDELRDIFGIEEKLTGATAQRIYDRIVEQLATPAFRPRSLYERFNIQTLCTTDAATDALTHHAALRASGWQGDVRPTFRPDAVVNICAPGWSEHIAALSRVSGIDVHDFASYIAALEDRRAFFKSMGATATDQGVLTPYTGELSGREADVIFQRALRGEADANDEARFTGHMLMEMARMSIEDGLVMQVHSGSLRNHNAPLYEGFGPDMGADIPTRLEYTRNLRPLLNKYGNDARLALILFTLDESTLSRELAPLAGHYPALKLGPPWWFFDSLNGMARYFDRVIETTGLYNTVGFNDDTRAFCSIPTRHDLWRRASANWLAGLVAREIIDLDDANEMIYAMAYGLAKDAYKL
ncbi:MAG TPA: glucuronate isomerase [Ktedonobacteraceae bacterium]|nr:glucuronate isomerase [Ktedonobacteraceae bacterium]